MQSYHSINAVVDGDEEGSGHRGIGTLCGANLTSPKGYSIRRWCGVRRSSCFLALYIVTYIAYLVGGGFLFRYLEKEFETNNKVEVVRIKSEFVKRHPDVSDESLEEFLEQITTVKASPLARNKNDSDWSFGQSFLFTVTVVTTIGYGHVTPSTPIGKIVCIMYAILGIPFTLVFLSALVQRLLRPTFSFLSMLLARLGSHIDPLEIRLIHLGIMGSLFICLVFVVPSALFFWAEPGWSYLDAMYFVFISLTTIGLGDYIPGDQAVHEPYRDAYKAGVGVYLLVGLVFLSLSLTVYYDIPQLNLGLHLHHHRDIFTDPDDQGKPIATGGLPNVCSSSRTTQNTTKSNSSLETKSTNSSFVKEDD